MYAKIEHTDQIPSDAAGAYLMTEIATGRSVLVSLWEDAGSYRVQDRWDGMAAKEEPGAASILYFDGPLSDARRAAGERGFAARVKPALVQVPGYVGGITLEGDDGSIVVIGLATTLAALEAGGVAVNSTELLPDEDPALLTGPDRVVVHRVEQAKA
jgi:hypothetical protein